MSRPPFAATVADSKQRAGWVDRGFYAAIEYPVLPDKRALLAEDGDEVALLPPVSGG